MKRLPVGVIGIGHLGSLHAKMLAKIPGAELVGLYDIEPSRTSVLASELRTEACSSMDALFARSKAVMIATPTRTHAEIAQQAIGRGIHVFIEKPITSTMDEAQKLVDAADRANVKIQVGHVERFNPALLALEKYNIHPMFIESHRLAQFNPRGADVAVVLDLMIHDIDIIMSLVHSPVADIEANGVAVISESIDIANARIRFENGCVANVTASRISQKKMRKMRMFQRDAYISVDFLDGAAEVFRLVNAGEPSEPSTMMLGAIEAGKVKRNIVYEQPEIKSVNALQYEAASFVDAVTNNREPVVGGKEGLAALQVAHQIMNKIDRQQIVVS